MWNRAEIKNRGKALFKRNYWKAVAAALLSSILMAGFGGAASYTGVANGFQGQQEGQDAYYGSSIYGDPDEYSDVEGLDDIDDIIDNIENSGQNRNPGSVNPLFPGRIARGAAGAVATAAIVAFIFALMVIIIAFIFVYSAFIANPVETGMQRFFIDNENGNAEVKSLMYAFDSNYKNIAWIMFYRTLYTFLWTLLFIIPGIIKSYEYRMIPYILAEDPNLSKEEVFGISKAMMTGNKWKAFVFDLSFIGWFLLSALTGGIVGMFYTNPYYYQSCAFLYEEIKAEYMNVIPRIPQDDM